MTSPGKALSFLLKSLLAAAILAAAAGLSARMIKTRPQAQRSSRPRSVPVVDVLEVSPGTERIDVEVMGTVIPARRLVLQPEISGRIVEIHPFLTAGGRVAEGDVLLRIDGREYELAVNQQRALVAKAEVELKIEAGRRVVAEQEWQLFESDVISTELGRQLALREPQLRRAEAELQSARDGLSRALLNVERTSIAAPFNALVLEESVEKGQLVTPQSRLATLVGTDEFHVQVSVPVSKLPSIRLPDDEGRGGAEVSIIVERTLGGSAVKQGRVARLLGELDPEGRMARLNVSVLDPLDLKGGRGAPLLLGSYVKAVIEGKSAEGVFRVPRTALREGDVLWLLREGERLEIRPVAVSWRGRDDVLIDDGLERGDLVVTTTLSAPLPGMELRRRGTAEIGDEPASSAGKPPGAGEGKER